MVKESLIIYSRQPLKNWMDQASNYNKSMVRTFLKTNINQLVNDGELDFDSLYICRYLKDMHLSEREANDLWIQLGYSTLKEAGAHLLEHSSGYSLIDKDKLVSKEVSIKVQRANTDSSILKFKIGGERCIILTKKDLDDILPDKNQEEFQCSCGVYDYMTFIRDYGDDTLTLESRVNGIEWSTTFDSMDYSQIN